MNRENQRRPQIERLESRLPLNGAPALAADLNLKLVAGFGNPRMFTEVNGALFFVANSAQFGTELFISDGTADGTRMIRDINAGSLGASNPNYLVNVNGVLYFSANDGVTGQELWKSDGTEAGTIKVADLYAGELGSSPRHLANVDGVLYFAADRLEDGVELWKYDGLEASAVLVRDLSPGPAPSSPRDLFNFNGTLMFVANDGIHGPELWRSDGTAAGTTLVRDIHPGNALESGGPRSGMAIGNTFYFVANNGATGYELWKSDGTTAGTVILADLNGSANSTPYHLTNFNGRLFFVASTYAHGEEIWSYSDYPGASLLRNINPDIGSSTPADLIVANGYLYFTARSNTSEEIWRSDGTRDGTVQVSNLALPINTRPRQLTNVNGTIFFTVDENRGAGDELWKLTSGSPTGASRVKNIRAGSAGAAPRQLIAFDNQLFFQANDGTTGIELWKSDGTEAGTQLVKDIDTATAGSAPSSFTHVAGSTYFLANDGTQAPQLWRRDETDGAVVRALTPPFLHNFGNLTAVNDVLYFTASDYSIGNELWKIEDPAAGAVLVRDIKPGSYGDLSYRSSAPQQLTNVDGVLFFVANDGLAGNELWKSDGTTDGTKLVKDVKPGRDSWGAFTSLPASLLNVGGQLYFTADDGIAGRELWKSDGSEAGTVLVKDLNPGPDDGYIRTPIAVRDALFFIGRNTPYNIELWKTDGTEAGTVQLTFDTPSWPTNMSAVGDRLFFSLGELWISDGTAAGTTQLRDIRPGESDSVPSRAVDVHGIAYFTANDGIHGFELWRSDGTEFGTRLVRDVNAGPSNSSLKSLVNVNGRLYFSATDNVAPGMVYRGDLLWRSDGSEWGTVPLPNPATDTGYLRSDLLTNANGVLYFKGDDQIHGAEVWTVIPQTTPGDYSKDGLVDGADFLAWQRSFGAAAAPTGSGADGDGDGTVGVSDLDVWKGNFGLPESSVLTAAVAALVAEEESPASAAIKGEEELGTAREQSAREALFAAGDFSRLFGLGGDGEFENSLRRWGRASLARRG